MPVHLARQLARIERTRRNIGARYSSWIASGHQRMTSVKSLTPQAFSTNAAAAKKPGQLQRASRSGTAVPVRSM